MIIDRDAKTKSVSIFCGDFLNLIQDIPDQSVDAIITDPPYGLTDNKWDKQIPFETMWTEFNRVVKDDSPMVLFSLPPFSSKMIVSNISQYRYTWIWDKRAPVGFLNANLTPLRRFEMILVFSRKMARYYPQMTKGVPYVKRRTARTKTDNYGKYIPTDTFNDGLRYPVDILDQWPNHNFRKEGNPHPTRKPIGLIEYLVKTYTKVGDVVLDPFLGSGTTAIACLNTGRECIGMEIEEDFYRFAQERIKISREQTKLFEF